MKELIPIFIWVVIIGGLFAVAWHKGYLERFADYIRSTNEELKKCSWPTYEELKGSTIVVMITILIMGLYTVGVDFVLAHLIRVILSFSV